MSYTVTYELMESDIGPIFEKMAHITIDPNGDVLTQIVAQLRQFHPQRVHVISYEEDNDDYLLMDVADYCF